MNTFHTQLWIPIGEFSFRKNICWVRECQVCNNTVRCYSLTVNWVMYNTILDKNINKTADERSLYRNENEFWNEEYLKKIWSEPIIK